MNFEKTYIFVYTFLDIEIIFWPFILKGSKRLSKLPSVCPSQHFEVTKIFLKKKWRRKKNCPFSNIGRKICDLLTKLFPRGFQNCIPRLHFKHSEEEIFLEKVICLIILSGNWRKNSRNCGKIFSARLWPLLCKYPRKQFKEGQFYREKKHFYHFRTMSFFSLFHRKHLASHWNYFLPVHGKVERKKV